MSSSNPLYDNDSSEATTTDDDHEYVDIVVVVDGANSHPSQVDVETPEDTTTVDERVSSHNSNNLPRPQGRASAFSSTGSSGGHLAFPHLPVPSFLADKDWKGKYGHHVAVRNKRSLYSRVFYPPMRRRNARRDEGLSPPVFMAIVCAGLMMLILGIVLKTFL